MNRSLLLSPILFLLALLGTARGQGSFVETFDDVGPLNGSAGGPENLVNRGWQFSNQSAPLGSSAWLDGTFFTPQAGAGTLQTDSLSTDFFGGRISHWVILPAVPSQQAGDTLTLHVRSVSSSNIDTLELRYSPSGGTDSGASATDVGDFTTLLLDVNPMPTSGWQLVSAVLPGPGAIALRYEVDWACNFTCFSSVIAIDTLSVGPPPPPPCNLPDIPPPGQTLTWTAAGGPYEICSDLSVPAGTTVLVEPGTVINVTDGFSLAIDGLLVTNGTAGSPVRFNGGFSLVPPPFRVHGEMELHHTVVNSRVHVEHGGSLLSLDCDFPGGVISTDDSVGGTDRGTFVSVIRGSFSGTPNMNGLSVTDGTLAVRDSSFVGTGISLLRGYLLADNVTLDGAGVSIIRERYTQPFYLDNLVIQNVAGPAFFLYGWNFQLGANNVISGNLVPVRTRGGLLSGSVVPATGNLNNYVDAMDSGVVGSVTWARLDVPWVVDGFAQSGGALRIEPGAVVQFTPGSGRATVSTGRMQARGRPDAPILFQEHVPGANWNRMMFGFNISGSRFEYCTIEGADTGVQSDDSYVQVDRSILRDNQVGVAGSTFGVVQVRGSRFLNNQIGASTTPRGGAWLTGGPNPNSFEGNLVGLQVSGSNVPAIGNWWGDASGPQHTSNPSGQGDLVTGLATVVPYLTAAPDFEVDTAPQVFLERHHPVVNPGSRLLLSWDTEDDGSIVAHRILFSEHGNLGYVTLADNLPGSARSHEIVMPTAFPSSNNNTSYVKVVAVDDSGQEGYAELSVFVPYTADVQPGTLTFLTDLSGPFTFGDDLQVCWNYSGPSATWNAMIQIDGEMHAVNYGGAHTGISCWNFRMPYVSTDTARVVLSLTLGAGGRNLLFYSQPFTIRPDPRIGDQPPQITLSAPAPFSILTGGEPVQIQWTANDDEALRSIAIQASYDGGRNWHMLVENLPPTATSYWWQLPGSAGIPDVILRALATDRRFQSSSDSVNVAILPGLPGDCQQDIGFSGPGQAMLSLCGDPLATGGSADLLLQSAPASSMALLVLSSNFSPTPFRGGVLVPVPMQFVLPMSADPSGQIRIPAIQGGGGPATLYAQYIIADLAAPLGAALSNALRIEFLP